MDDKLVTLSILTYSKAQILKSVLENEGIETVIHNINQIQPLISTGVRVRIKEKDLPKALRVIESSAWLSESVIGEKPTIDKDQKKKILVPVDFSSYSIKACEFAFNLAKTINSEVILLHVYFTPVYSSSLPYGDVFNYQITDDVTIRTILQKVHSDLNHLSNTVKDKIKDGEFPNVKYSCVLREGIPEEEILRYSKEQQPIITIMGTRGRSQKDVDLLGSVTAEVIERSRIPVLAIPENTPFNSFDSVKRIGFITNFNQRDLIAFDTFITAWNSFKFSISLLYLADPKTVTDAWNKIKLAGIKDYFQNQYPTLDIKYDIVLNDDLLENLDKYINESKIDVITIISYKRNIFARLFNPSIAKKVIFHSDTPLLVING